MINTGRRPIRSDSAPKNGVATNCINEYDANSTPTVNGDAPNCSAYKGNNGKIMPKPSKPTNTIKNIGNNGERNSRFIKNTCDEKNKC
jgi:hypothetical protein